MYLMANNYFHYYVEGKTDEKMVSILKSEYQFIIPGKVETFNIIEKELTRNRTMLLKKGTIVVLVFDTDTQNNIILDKNIKFLQKQSNISKIYCITQVRNLEEELIRSCSIREIKELTESKSNTEFKKDMLKQNNFKDKLDSKKFDMNKFWSSSAPPPFSHIRNEAFSIKKH